MVLTPAYRWRVVLERTREVEHDVIQEAVLRLHAAGEREATRIADRLQLPEELVRHLLAQRVTQGWAVAGDGRIEATSTEVSWVYRDLATSELWPDPAREQPPLPVQFSGPFKASFVHGSVGSSTTVHCRLLETRQHTFVTPTSLELARFSRASGDANRRTAVVSEAEPCLVASPVVGAGRGHAIQTSRNAPHLSLTRELQRASADHQSWQRWLEQIPTDRPAAAGEPPLRAAVRDLHDALADTGWTPTGLLTRIEIALSRYVDAYLYAYLPVEDDQVAQHAEELADKIDRLLTTQVSSAAPLWRQLTGLRECCDRWQVAVASPPDARVLGRLATTTIELCTTLLDMTEEDHG
jgi:hypothetical protein